MNCRMPELKRALEAAGFEDVKTLLSSGNAVFTAKKASNEAIQRKAEAAMKAHLGQAFTTFVRPVDELAALLASDPYKGVRLQPASKKIVTFLRGAPEGLKLPVERDEARVLKLDGKHLFTVYAPTPKGPVFMKLIESAVGKEQTTRTWDTVAKVARS